jgi:transposase InsO family protein
LVARRFAGEAFNVGVECARLGVSTKTFYKYLNRFRVEGVDGLYPRSRRPVRSPRMVSAAVEDLVLRARKDLLDGGHDDGADQIGYWLEQWRHDHLGQWPPGQPVPSRATINRILTRRGQIVATPQRQPKRTRRRFEATRPNAMWQMDGFEVRLATGVVVVVLHILDDCSRFDLALRAARSENAVDVWATFVSAATRYRLPRSVLTDNGTAFSGRRRGWTSALEANLTELSVRHITSSVAHPQTCGKVERAHKTVRRWLRKQPVPATLADLQTLLDTYRDHYNQRRRKHHLGGLTPAQRYTLGPLDAPGGPFTPPAVFTTATVSASGCIQVNTNLIGIGRRYKHTTVTLIRQGTHLAVFSDNHLIAEITLQRGQHYIPQTP